MTIETRIIVGLNDILSVQLECAKCRAKVVRSPDVTLTLPHACGQCGATWRPGPEEFGEDPMAVRLVRLISALRQSNDRAFAIKFEFFMPSASQTSAGQQ